MKGSIGKKKTVASVFLSPNYKERSSKKHAREIVRYLPNFRYDPDPPVSFNFLGTVKESNVKALCQNVLFLEDGSRPRCRSDDTMEVYYDCLINKESRYVFSLFFYDKSIGICIYKVPGTCRHSERNVKIDVEKIPFETQYFYKEED